jgi:hypothetical protein
LHWGAVGPGCTETRPNDREVDHGEEAEEVEDEDEGEEDQARRPGAQEEEIGEEERGQAAGCEEESEEAFCASEVEAEGGGACAGSCPGTDGRGAAALGYRHRRLTSRLRVATRNRLPPSRQTVF